MRELVELRNRMTRLSKEWDRLSLEYDKVVKEATHFRDNYEIVKANALLETTGTIPERQARVTIACQQEAEKCHTAEAKVEFFKQRLKTIAGILNGLQTEAALLRDSMKL